MMLKIQIWQQILISTIFSSFFYLYANISRWERCFNLLLFFVFFLFKINVGKRKYDNFFSVTSKKLLRVGIVKGERESCKNWPCFVSGNIYIFRGVRYFMMKLCDHLRYLMGWLPRFVSGTFMLLFLRISISSYLKELISCLTFCCYCCYYHFFILIHNVTLY